MAFYLLLLWPVLGFVLSSGDVLTHALDRPKRTPVGLCRVRLAGRRHAPVVPGVSQSTKGKEGCVQSI